MRKAAGLALFLSFVTAATATADVRDDYRSCEQRMLAFIKRGDTPKASSADDEYCLGLGYWFASPGNRLVRDPAKAVYWHTKAVEHGSREAQVALAYHYEKGHGVGVDIDKAVGLYRKAAAQGDVNAMFNLGRLYSLGRGVPKDEAESKRWMQRARQGGNAEALVDQRKSHQYEMLESQKREVFQAGHRAYEARNYVLAATLFQEARQAGNASASVALGQLYRQGLGVSQDFKMATELFREAAVRGHARGQVQLGLNYEMGEGVAENWTEAISWYKKSAAQLDALGLHAMGRAYQFGIAVPQDRTLAVKFYEKAENQGQQHSAWFARWLRVPSNCLGYFDDKEREKFAGVCSDPKGITFNNSAERTAWLAETLRTIPVDMFGSNSYQEGACSAAGGEFRRGNCYGSGGVMFEPGTQDRSGRNLW